MVSRKRRGLALFLLAESESCWSVKTKRSRRSAWVKDWLANCRSQGCFDNLMRELCFEDPDSYRRWIRMDEDSFRCLVELITPLVIRQDTMMRDSIPVAQRLALTLRFLSTGASYQNLSFDFRISKSAVSEIVPEVCDSLYEVLQPDYLAVPSSPDTWLHLASQFQSLWKFPNCIGALDGKHVMVQKPDFSGSDFYNYKGAYSIVLLAIVDADLKAVYIEVGAQGRCSDGGIWNRSKMKAAIDSNQLNLFKARPLEGTDVALPPVIVAGAGFGLGRNLMHPYAGKDLSEECLIFNYRLSRARRVVENFFGILTSRWEIFRSPIRLSPDKAVSAVRAAVVLHNYLRARTGTRLLYTPPGLADTELREGDLIRGEWRQGSTASWRNFSGSRFNCSGDAKRIRDIFKTYFNGPGAVTWQRTAYKRH